MADNESFDSFVKRLKKDKSEANAPPGKARPPTGRQARPPAGRPPTGRGPKPKSPDTSKLWKQIEDKAKVISVDKLQRSGTQHVRVISPKLMLQIVGDSFGSVLDRHVMLTDEERQRIQKEARAEFNQLMMTHRKVQEEQSEGDRQRAELERTVEVLRRDLHAQQGLLQKERSRDLARVEGMTFSQESLDEMERRMRALLARVLEHGELSVDGSGELVGAAGFEAELGESIGRVIAAERTRAQENVTNQGNEAIDVLERRIAKLTRALEDSEASLKGGAPGTELRTAYGARGGLKPVDPRRAWREGVLRRVFLENLELTGQEPSEADRSGEFPAPRGD